MKIGRALGTTALAAAMCWSTNGCKKTVDQETGPPPEAVQQAIDAGKSAPPPPPPADLGDPGTGGTGREEAREIQ